MSYNYQIKMDALQKNEMNPFLSQKMQSAVKILQLSKDELLEQIELELLSNPVLEITESDPVEKEAEKVSDEPKEVSVSENFKEDIEWSYYENEYGYDNLKKNKKDSSIHDNIPSYVSLHEYLLCQFSENFDLPEKECDIAKFLIMNIDKNGYLKIAEEKAAELMSASAENIETIIQKIQRLEPAGICARDLKECLFIQLQRANLKKPIDSIVEKIIKNHLDDLGDKNLKNICNALKINMKTASKAIAVIKEFNPYPGQQFAVYEAHGEQIKIPDIFIKEDDGKFHIKINKKGIPILGINRLYERLMSETADSSEKKYIRKKLDSAAWFLKCIKMREETVLDIVKSIINFQKEFFLKGILEIKPLTLSRVAQEIGKHESTVSRAVRNKYLYCIHGIFELKDFFNASIAVKIKMKNLIKKEDCQKPYTDDILAQLLQKSGVDITRRTVAKYRNEMNISPASKRKK